MKRVWTYPTKAVVSVVLVGAALFAVSAGAGAAATQVATSSFTSVVFASGTALMHDTPSGMEAISNPDDITSIGSDIFVGFQNGVGPQGQPSTAGNRDSTVVEFDSSGTAVKQWDIVGKCDGLTADRATGRLIATVNEDANSSVYVINPKTGSAVHYSYNRALPSKGGTDAISIYRGMVLISASAPGTTGSAAPQPNYPAVYRVAFNTTTRVASVYPLFYDEARATVANTDSRKYGWVVRLALTDPDSNEVVPSFARRFAGDFMLTSQGDKEQIYVRGAGGPFQTRSVLKLSDSVDDTAWASSSSGAVYTTDNGADIIYKITGPFKRGAEYVADTPCDANGAPSTCPGPGFSANFFGQLNPWTGVITRLPISGPAPAAQGMLFEQ